MHPLTALLESLHSALIDELNERMPDDKVTLGMPLRQKTFALPTAELSTVFHDVTFNQEKIRGFVILAFDGEAAKLLNTTSQELWGAVVRRAGTEFLRRGIKPALGPTENLSKNSLPERTPTPSRIVWSPFIMRNHSIFLAIGA